MPRRHGEQGTGGLCVRRAGGTRAAGGRPLSVRRDGDGRHPRFQSRSGNAARRRHLRLRRGGEHDDQPHHHGHGARRGVR